MKYLAAFEQGGMYFAGFSDFDDIAFIASEAKVKFIDKFLSRAVYSQLVAHQIMKGVIIVLPNGRQWDEFMSKDDFYDPDDWPRRDLSKKWKADDCLGIKECTEKFDQLYNEINSSPFRTRSL